MFEPRSSNSVFAPSSRAFRDLAVGAKATGDSTSSSSSTCLAPTPPAHTFLIKGHVMCPGAAYEVFCIFKSKRRHVFRVHEFRRQNRMGWVLVEREREPKAPFMRQTLDSDLRRGFFFLQSKQKSLPVWWGHIHVPEPFADTRYSYSLILPVAFSQKQKLENLQSEKYGRERGLFWFMGCIFLNHQITTKFKEQKHMLLRKCPLLRSPEEACLPLG